MSTHLLTMSLPYILMSRLRSDIGWKFLGEVDSFPGLGFVTTVASTIPERNEEEVTLLNIEFMWEVNVMKAFIVFSH